MIQFAIGLLSLVGYIVYRETHPLPPLSDEFEMETSLVHGNNYILPPERERGPKHFPNPNKPKEYKRLTTYVFKCHITPNKALLRDASIHEMKVPQDYMINEFHIGVHSDNTVEYLDLGKQYHSDRCPKSHCVFLGHLMGEKLTIDLMKDIMDLLLTYELDNPMDHRHWDNADFHKSNQGILETMKRISAT
jgi:hypothetical protein